MSISAILIFDVGKTNKKVLLFDEQYKLLWEESTQIEEKTDEDGFPCEDVFALTDWVQQKYSAILSAKDVHLKAVNFSAYGASLVHLDRDAAVTTPLYNYLKPYPDYLKKQFYDKYGGEQKISEETASPVLGSLNSGMQLYRLKHEQPEDYNRINCSLHLPQYLSWILSKAQATDISSVGCHTMLWDFKKRSYHHWVYEEGVDKKLAPLYHGYKTNVLRYNDELIPIGIGIHDSSAALIPYLSRSHEPFILISTGTWNISLNPFNHNKLTSEELGQDCLCYLSYKGEPVKASRLFAGYEHEQQIKKLGEHFNKSTDYFQSMKYDATLIHSGRDQRINGFPFAAGELSNFTSCEQAYHRLMYAIMERQVDSTRRVLDGIQIKKIFVDGGFGKNSIFMNLLASSFPGIEVYGATIPQASALGAALAIHESWNGNLIPDNLVDLKYYPNAEIKYST